MEKKHATLISIILAAGIILAGVLVYNGLKTIAYQDRAVSVKGLATREVKADYAVWPLSYSVSGNDLKALYAEEAGVAQTIQQLMIDKGFEAADIRHGKITVNDNWAHYYDHRPEYNYTLSASIVISTKNVDLVVKSQDCLNELMMKGILVNTNEWELDYQYNGLTDLKPEMIEEATKNARIVAQKFADDAECRLGSIRHANQGQFSIEADNYQPWMKHIRVVTTVDYYLK